MYGNETFFFLTAQVWESVLQFLLQFAVAYFQMLGYANRKKINR